jgi:predicted DNA-binding protein
MPRRDVYDVCMITERVQILLTPQQRRRLEDEAKRQARSVASLVREAIDARFSPIGRDERMAAVEAIRAMSGGPFLTPEQINRAVEEEREAILPGG